VNLSVRQLSDCGFSNLLAELIAHYQLPPGSVTLEVTEGVLVTANTGWQLLARMREIGARIALDDFGTGHSQLNYLRRFHFDEIKIDQSFVKDMHHDRAARAIVAAIPPGKDR
jgi:EAL domain-containing protein (putative c-di-GMP-specific phosphodiesterase class I)